MQTSFGSYDVIAFVATTNPSKAYPWMDQDAQGIWTSPSGARIAWFKDPDGNVLSLTEF